MITNAKRLIEAVRTTRKKTHNNDMDTGCDIIFTYLGTLTDDSRDVSLDYKINDFLLKKYDKFDKDMEKNDASGTNHAGVKLLDILQKNNGPLYFLMKL